MKSVQLFYVLLFVGFAIITGSLLLPIKFWQMPVWLAIVIGVFAGAPVLMIGLKMHPESKASDREGKRSFWPTLAERWGMLGLLVFAATILVPPFLFVAIMSVIPPGDGWGIVTIRVLTLAAFLGGFMWWIGFARTNLIELFRGKISDATLVSFKPTTEPEPKSFAASVSANWPLVVLAAIALCVAFGQIQLDNPWLNVGNGSRRFRGIAKMLIWCRGNPNTVASTSGLIGFGALAIFGYQIRSAILRGRSLSHASRE